jgi:hypothetical protein
MKRLSGAAFKRVVVIGAAAVVAGLGISSAAFASSGSSGAASAVPACTAGNLGAWVAVDQGNGAAGSVYLPLQFTNLSGHACSLHGFPGVSALDRSGHQLGSPANWDHVSVPRTVVLSAGATAHAVLRWSDATVTTAPGCHPVNSTFQLRIYPPNQRSATHAAFGLEACSYTGPIYLSVGPIIPGVGTING